MGLVQRKTYCGGNMTMNIKDKRYTIADIEALSEGERAELLDGKMYMMAAPTATHQRLVGFLYFEFCSYIKKNEGSCEVFLSPFSVYLNETDDYVEPDLIVVCGKDKVDEKGCHGAPDFVVEIVSPSSRRMDYVRKLYKFHTYGVQEYWIVDPEKSRIQVYISAEEDMKEYSFSDKVPVWIYDGKLEIDFSEFRKP